MNLGRHVSRPRSLQSQQRRSLPVYDPIACRSSGFRMRISVSRRSKLDGDRKQARSRNLSLRFSSSSKLTMASVLARRSRRTLCVYTRRGNTIPYSNGSSIVMARHERSPFRPEVIACLGTGNVQGGSEYHYLGRPGRSAICRE